MASISSLSLAWASKAARCWARAASSSWSCCLSVLRSGFAGLPGAGETDGDWAAGVEESWANAARLAPSGSTNAKAEPSTKRGSVRLARRRIIAFKGRPKPLKGKPLKGKPLKDKPLKGETKQAGQDRKKARRGV